MSKHDGLRSPSGPCVASLVIAQRSASSSAASPRAGCRACGVLETACAEIITQLREASFPPLCPAPSRRVPKSNDAGAIPLRMTRDGAGAAQPSSAPTRLSRNWTLRSQSKNAVLPPLRNDRRQHALTRLSSAQQCPLQRRRERLVGCDQLLAFGARISGDDRWAGLAVLVISKNASTAHLVSTFG